MSNCTSGCPTQDHESYGECLRSKSLRVAYANSASGADYTREKRAAANRQAYRDARRQGIQPDSSKIQDVRRAVEISNRTGVAYRAA